MRQGPPLLPGSVLVMHDGYGVEMMADGAAKFPDRLELIRDDVLNIAARSRGWEDPDDIAEFAKSFKIEGLFRSDALGLIWDGDRVVGVMGTTYHAGPDDSLVLHLGSLGLLGNAQRRGFLPTLFSLLLYVVGGRPGTVDRYRRGRVYFTAVTQSPYIMSLLAVLTELYPGPDWDGPDPDMVDVAKSVIEHYEPEVDFNPETFVLRKECDFRYRKVPYSRDKRLNDYCDSRLRYDEGDTFIVVGRGKQEAIGQFLQACQHQYPELFSALRTGLDADPDVAYLLSSGESVFHEPEPA